MTTRPITLLGQPVLRACAAEVVDFDRELRALVDDMVQTMHAAAGVGLAAPQVGCSRRVFVYEFGGELGHVVNPVLEVSGEEEDGEEGCLSIPEVYAEVRRPTRAVVQGQDVDGRQIRFEASDWLARIVQHETDHLDGVLFLDHLTGSTRRQAMKEVRDSDWLGEELRQDHLGSTPEFEDR